MIVDDQELLRNGLTMVVRSQPDVEVVAEAGDGLEALEVLRSRSVDVVVMDIRMPRMDGVTATREIQRMDNPPKVLALTTFDLDEHALAALRAGASGFLLKDAPGEEIIAAIRHVHRGDSIIAPATTRRLIGQLVARADTDPDAVLNALTEREREVFLGMARGASNAEIGAGLFLSETTVKTHVGRILAKLGLRDRVQAVVLAYESGVVTPGDREVQ
ncbi:response regulator transcription factor [Nonomuraea glycinis]|uniref:DNA-binding response regulator n=1 Tax=Nonomuraea glycinis TaxID=2047744 RepID=A0A918A376_9ACTN|nr:response regulator transcription factor [Nonomuraea glycinis]MCA2176728.1 response regulator transcription factor [Nonomuraea glycinis]GGP03430.1 DNA-binding response regulator [Nonomuraea glycinis]